MADGLDGIQLMLGPTTSHVASHEHQKPQQPLQYQGTAAPPQQCQQPQLQYAMVPFALPQSVPSGDAPQQHMLPVVGNTGPSSFAQNPVNAAAFGTTQANTPQALMGVLNLLQQNIGALQALVPLLASQSGGQQQPQHAPQQQEQQLQQQQPQQVMAMASSAGVVSAITQLANATASILPQLGVSAMQQQQQQPFQSQQQQQFFPVAAQEQPGAACLALHQPSVPQQEPRKAPQQQRPPHAVVTASKKRKEAVQMPKQTRGASSGDDEDADDASPGDLDDGNDESLPEGSFDIVEMDPVEILAEHTHFCEICGKGFKRDANLRMHMRGHGDEYKSASALARPDRQLLDQMDADGSRRVKRFSCPYVGCKRNKEHKRFTPLKTMLCVKNHYRRSHCPKMLTCSKCGTKRFSVVADLRTHEKHCGRDRWLCSCGTSFSRKDKLLGHLSLFVGHKAAEEDLSTPQKRPPPYDAPANSTSAAGMCSGRGGARDCVSSTLNLNNPSYDEDGVEREVVVYEPERQVTIVGQPAVHEPGKWGNAVFRQRPTTFSNSFL